jgi:hypothetical protein
MSEPDYEAIMADRDEEREQRWLARMDAKYGRVEDYCLTCVSARQGGDPCPLHRSRP